MKKFPVLKLLLNDLRQIRMDGTLLLMAGAVPGIYLVTARALPILNEILASHKLIQLTGHLRFIIMTLYMVIPLLSGMLVSFLMVDEKDEGILQQISVTPMGVGRFFIYKYFFAFCLAFPFLLLMFYFQPLLNLSWMNSVALAFIYSLESPLIILPIVSFAHNKIEAMALAKLTGITLLFPVAAYFSPDWGASILAVFPWSWIEIFSTSTGFLTLFAALAVHLLWLLPGQILFVSRFQHR